MKKFATLTLLIVSACALPDDYTGNVVDITDHVVRIEGTYGDGKPSIAMQERADRLCGGESEFVGVSTKPGSTTTTSFGPFGPTYTTGPDIVTMHHYTFACI